MRQTTPADLGLTEQPEPVKANVRLWDADWNLQHTIEGIVIKSPPNAGCRTIELDLDAPAARWLQALSIPNVRATVDTDSGRWSGALVEYAIRRAGDCAHCDHCMRKYMTVTFG